MASTCPVDLDTLRLRAEVESISKPMWFPMSGCGVGGLTFELLERGVERAVAVDASAAYLAAAAQEATRRDRLGAVEFRNGDFLDVASTLPPAAVVTMDRVICCYPA